MGTLYTECADAWLTFLDCTETTTLSCNDEGKAAAPECSTESLAYALCVVNNAE
jgi:hypothetical protein